MSEPGQELLSDLPGAAAPPRSNGELVFAAPWESRVFGITMALHERGAFSWDEFRRHLIEEIAGWESARHPPEQWSYYACWSSALERLLADKGLCKQAELARRARALAARHPGHDH